MKKSKHIGSNFDDFLQEEEMLEEIEEVVAKRVFVFHMKKKVLVKSKRLQKMKRSRSNN